MNARRPISPYARAVRYMLLTAAAGPILVFIVPAVLTASGMSKTTVGSLGLVLGLGWVFIGGAGTLLLSCPKCGKLLMMRGIMAVPWPPKVCRRCGVDLTRAPAAR